MGERKAYGKEKQNEAKKRRSRTTAVQGRQRFSPEKQVRRGSKRIETSMLGVAGAQPWQALSSSSSSSHSTVVCYQQYKTSRAMRVKGMKTEMHRAPITAAPEFLDARVVQ